MFVGTFGAGALRIYRNHPGVGFDPWWEGRVPGEGYVGTVADLNDDGYPDLIVGEEGTIRVLLNRVAIPRVKSLSMSLLGPRMRRLLPRLI